MFKILSLDGGGARGAFIAGFLRELEDKTGEPISDYFDLVAGTSTGAVIGVLLALGNPMSDVEELYSKYLSKIFTINKPYFSSLTGRAFTASFNPLVKYFTGGVNLDELFRSRYSFEGVISFLKDYTKNTKLANVDRTRLVIPATNLIQGRPYVFKTFHLPDQSDSYDFYTLDVLLATAAAPGYFDPVTLPGHGIFSDGGIWANNPGLVAYAEAVKISSHCKREVDTLFTPDDITMLSIGTGHASDNFSPPYLKAGVRWWSRRLMELMFESQTQSSNYYLEQLLHDKYIRVNFERPHPGWGRLDDHSYAKDIAQMGRLTARKKYPILKDVFFAEKTKRFVPYTLQSTSNLDATMRD